MQLQRGVLVAGIDPETARLLARAVHGAYRDAGEVGWRVGIPEQELAPMLDALASAGFLLRLDSSGDAPEEEPAHDDGSWPKWRTTLRGGALTMASFLKPITRAKAESLMEGVLQRAADYNADASKPFLIREIRAFGSYITDAPLLGDLDLALDFSDRSAEADRAKVALAYARSSGRTFSTFVDELYWPEKELLQILRNRSGYINVHTEEISRFTDRWQVVYSYLRSS